MPGAGRRELTRILQKTYPNIFFDNSTFCVIIKSITQACLSVFVLRFLSPLGVQSRWILKHIICI